MAFESLKNLPISFWHAQCVSLEDEILICGGFCINACYSYHLVVQDYKSVCTYPTNLESALNGHGVIKCEKSASTKSKDKKKEEKVDIEEEMLLSFGGESSSSNNHVLLMKYKSVWENPNYQNVWHPLRNGFGSNHYMEYVRAVISGPNDSYLFIVYPLRNLAVIDLNSLQCIAKEELPIERLWFGSCFVKANDELLLFTYRQGLSIKQIDNFRRLKYQVFSVCDGLKDTNSYSFVCLRNSVVVFFGGYQKDGTHSNHIFQFFVHDQSWKLCPLQMPVAISGTCAVVERDALWIHIIGGHDGNRPKKRHCKIKTKEFIGVYLFFFFFFLCSFFFFFFKKKKKKQKGQNEV
ncbi:hypothetical protein RFI_18087 [Reticulomyxa filosa]|uniref:Kelch motif family protein n=1 Tax=Reticulomyxa filosa TaxID=46433 RepID=X6N076_RETFI|nr:hypothetical protein RFI_18087 [Reticulomyxa filosa]|eukprot:ETO19144.1 hypothetical protein RFI_18087 [Reticulomyxa filosa]